MKIDPDLVARFNSKWAKDKKSDCFLWIGASLPKGYGIIKRPGERRQYYAHRLAYMIHKGEIPDRVQVCHSCDNPSCVNPKHLFLGTSKDNHQDMKVKNRHLYGERNTEAKLTDRDVKEIRVMWVAGVRQRKIGLAYGVCQGTISRIVLKKRWVHVKA